MKVGGLIYVVGVVFFKSDGRIPCAHAIWHMFVAAAAGFHYYAILNYLYPTDIEKFHDQNFDQENIENPSFIEPRSLEL